MRKNDDPASARRFVKTVFDAIVRDAYCKVCQTRLLREEFGDDLEQGVCKECMQKASKGPYDEAFTPEEETE